MELFVVRLDGLEVALADSERLAEQYARQHCGGEPTLDVEVARVSDDLLCAFVPSPIVAEAATA